MTVPVQTPFIEYIASGETEFTFAYEQIEPDDMRVLVDQVEQEFGVDYTITEFDPEAGGKVVFSTAPKAGLKVLIERVTPITQQLDYTNFGAFPAESHEHQMDKDTYILQELILGGFGDFGSVDLGAIQQFNGIEITNTAGSGAFIPVWNPNEVMPLAGSFLGEITLSAPADGSLTSKPDGFVFFEVLP
jgi:hypothetical protein